MIILENLDFVWKEEQIEKVKSMWDEGIGIKEISLEIKRKTEETFLLLLHLSLKDQIRKRKNYIWG